jgi:hypothetical protein
VAAASLAFSGGGGSASNASRSPAPAPSLPQRSTSVISSPSSSTSEIDKLVTRKVCITTASSSSHALNNAHHDICFQTGILNALKKGPVAHVAIPSSFPTPKNTFGPPPLRRTTSETNTTEPVKSPPVLPRRQAEPEPEEPEGEWGEVLYDYSSEV